jgi:hypothetical protein
VLVRDHLTIPVSKEGNWPTIDNFLRHFFGEDPTLRQYERFLVWSATVLRSVHGVYYGGKTLQEVRQVFLVLFLVGKPRIGKSFLIQHILLPLLGNEAAKPFAHMNGAMNFNADTARTILQICDDESGTPTDAARKKHAQMLKAFASDDPVRIHGKGQDAFYAPVFATS